MKYKHLLISLIMYFMFFIFGLAFVNTEASASADNSLSTLKIEGLELEPAFKYSRLKYTATVDNTVTEVKINAVTSNKAAKILSISGNTDLKVGENVISIVVQAKNGRKATYTITLTRLDAESSPNTAEATEATEITSTTSGTQSTKKTKKQLRAEIAEKNLEIEELSSTITGLNESYEALKQDYKNVVDENQKIYSHRTYLIIITVLMLFALIIALFIGFIKKSTYRVLRNEFGYGEAEVSVEGVTAKMKAVKKSSDSFEEVTKKSDDYAIMDRKPRTDISSVDMLSDIEKKIADELNRSVPEVIRKNEKDEIKIVNTVQTQDDFSFDIIEI